MRSRKLSLSAIRRALFAVSDVVEGTCYGTAAWRHRGRLLARLHQDGESIMFKVGFEAREHLMRADPRTFFITDHYRNYPSVLARLDRLTAADVKALASRAVGHATPKRRGATRRA